MKYFRYLFLFFMSSFLITAWCFGARAVRPQLKAVVKAVQVVQKITSPKVRTTTIPHPPPMPAKVSTAKPSVNQHITSEMLLGVKGSLKKVSRGPVTSPQHEQEQAHQASAVKKTKIPVPPSMPKVLLTKPIFKVTPGQVINQKNMATGAPQHITPEMLTKAKVLLKSPSTTESLIHAGSQQVFTPLKRVPIERYEVQAVQKPKIPSPPPMPPKPVTASVQKSKPITPAVLRAAKTNLKPVAGTSVHDVDVIQKETPVVTHMEATKQSSGTFDALKAVLVSQVVNSLTDPYAIQGWLSMGRQQQIPYQQVPGYSPQMPMSYDGYQPAEQLPGYEQEPEFARQQPENVTDAVQGLSADQLSLYEQNPQLVQPQPQNLMGITQGVSEAYPFEIPDQSLQQVAEEPTPGDQQILEEGTAEIPQGAQPLDLSAYGLPGVWTIDDQGQLIPWS